MYSIIHHAPCFGSSELVYKTLSKTLAAKILRRYLFVFEQSRAQYHALYLRGRKLNTEAFLSECDEDERKAVDETIEETDNGQTKSPKRHYRITGQYVGKFANDRKKATKKRLAYEVVTGMYSDNDIDGMSDSDKQSLVEV